MVAIGTVFLFLFSTTCIGALENIVTGKPHNVVQILDETNFDEAVNDPANGLWFIKFYAPWCGHCQKMAPTLDAIAPYLEGKMAIGKVDCTSSSSKKLCKDRFEVRGYPTMKIYRDGNFFDYPGNRDADSIIIFAEKMSAHPIRHVVSSYNDGILNIIDGNKDADVKGVAFIAYDPNAKISENTDDMLTSTTSLQVFGQVARKMQAYASFGLIHPMTSNEELEKFGIKDKTSPIFMKVEKNVGSLSYEGEITSADFLDFVNENNVALVTVLDGNNFRSMGHRGRKLAIAALLPDDLDHDGKSSQLLKDFTAFALKAEKDIRNKYHFASIDGKKWMNFLKQFSIEQNGLPQVFILDVPKRIFWQHSTITTIPDFFSAVASGEIVGKEQVRSNASSFFEKMESWFISNVPYSIILVVMLVVVFVLFAALLFDEDDISMQDGRLQTEISMTKKNK